MLSQNESFQSSVVKPVPYPEFFWAYMYMYQQRDLNERIGEHTNSMVRKYVSVKHCKQKEIGSIK